MAVSGGQSQAEEAKVASALGKKQKQAVIGGAAGGNAARKRAAAFSLCL